MTNPVQETMPSFNTTTSTNPSSLSKMQYTRLGRSGLKISKIILGTMSFGDPSTSTAGAWTQPPSEALPILKYAFDRGINTWDTADFYGLGSSEAIIGQAIREYGIPRERLVLMTKVFFGMGEELKGEGGTVNSAAAMVNDGAMVNRVGLSRKHILEAVEASVKR
jgi:aryl-alcohol dehydrogenase-like predicted oxidoreductase